MKKYTKRVEEIVEGLNKMQCQKCGGQGGFAEHNTTDTRSEHINDEDCRTCPVQEQCQECHAIGYLFLADEVTQALSQCEEEAKREIKKELYEEMS